MSEGTLLRVVAGKSDAVMAVATGLVTGRIYVSTDDNFWIVKADGTARKVSGTLQTASYSFGSASSGTHYIGGFYESPVTDANLTQASTTQVIGSANLAYGAHAFLVAGAVGTASGGSGAVTITVTGTSITDAGVRTAADTETIVADITTLSTNDYLETPKKWIGQITFTLDVGATGHTTYAADFNYGFATYEDINNSDFTVTGLSITGDGGAADTGFNLLLCHHKSTGWTYHATAFVPGTTAVVDMNIDYVTEINIANGEKFKYKRANLNTTISGSTDEGVLIMVETTANNAVDHMDIHLHYTID